MKRPLRSAEPVKLCQEGGEEVTPEIHTQRDRERERLGRNDEGGGGGGLRRKEFKRAQKL